jgi:hypothetical protein
MAEVGSFEKGHGQSRQRIEEEKTPPGNALPEGLLFLVPLVFWMATPSGVFVE